jgi:mono/diheme cytochrome c family protein
MKRLLVPFKICAALLFSFGVINSSTAQGELSFTTEQIENGKALYQEHCQICHGTKLSNGQFGNPLKGSFFRKNWSGQSVGALVFFTYESMPPENTKALPLEQYTEIVSYILERNKVEVGDKPLSADINALNDIMLPWL